MKTHIFLALAAFILLNNGNAFADSETVTKIVSDINRVSKNLLSSPMVNPSLAGASTSMQAQLNRCMADAGLSDTSLLTKSKKSNSALPESCSRAPLYKSLASNLKGLCEVSITPADGPKACTSYLKDKTKSEDKSKYDPTALFDDVLFENDKDNAACYAEILDWKLKNCNSKDLEEFKKQYKAVQCQMDALQQGVADASKKIQDSLNANNASFSEMMNIEKELVDQKKQVTDMLGPDPELGESRGFGGLIALQKKIEEAVAAYKSKKAEFTNSIAQIKEETEKNEQDLDSSAMEVVTACMQGDRTITTTGGKSLMCSKPEQPIDKDGKPIPGSKVSYRVQACGAMEWMRSKVRESAYRSGKDIRASAFRDDEANKRVARFDGAMQGFLRDLGAYETKTASGGKLKTRIQNWDQLNQAYGGKLAGLSRDIGYDVTGSIKKVADYCFKESKTWKKQQVDSASSDYRKRRKEIEDNKSKLASTLDGGLTSLNSNYSEVVAALGGKHVALNRAPCSKDLDKMNQCYNAIERNLTDLLEGNSSSEANTFSTKQIAGGNKVPGFSVVCNGLNGCITNLKQVRDTQARAITYNRQKRQDWVARGNNTVSQTITSFAVSLNQLQNNVLRQYSQMKEKLISMGVGGKVPDRPKFMKTSQLEQSEHPATEKGLPDERGPYKLPKDGMDSILAGMMQPGLIDFTEPGFKDALTAAEEKAEKSKEAVKKKVDDALDKAKKFADIDPAGGCDKFEVLGPKSDGSGSSSAQVGFVACDNCRQKLNSCMKLISESEQKNNDYETALQAWKACNRDDCGPMPIRSSFVRVSNSAPLLTQLNQLLDVVQSGDENIEIDKLKSVSGLPFDIECSEVNRSCNSMCESDVKKLKLFKEQEKTIKTPNSKS